MLYQIANCCFGMQRHHLFCDTLEQWEGNGWNNLECWSALVSLIMEFAQLSERGWGNCLGKIGVFSRTCFGLVMCGGVRGAKTTSLQLGSGKERCLEFIHQLHSTLRRCCWLAVVVILTDGLSLGVAWSPRRSPMWPPCEKSVKRWVSNENGSSWSCGADS